MKLGLLVSDTVSDLLPSPGVHDHGVAGEFDAEWVAAAVYSENILHCS